MWVVLFIGIIENLKILRFIDVEFEMYFFFEVFVRIRLLDYFERIF